MNLKEEIKNEEKDLSNLFARIIKRDFSGTTGLVLKNSLYQFSTNLIAKIGALAFTIILARLLMPDLFGLYSLALSTILLFASFADLGIGQAIIRFVAKSLSKNNKKEAKAYFVYFLTIKSFLVIGVSLSLLLASNFIANSYYHKPIYFALLAGSFYILCISFLGVFDSFFQAQNNFRYSFLKELLQQSLRLILVPLIVLYSLQTFTINIVLSNIILSLAVVYLFMFLFMGALAYFKSPLIKLNNYSLSISQRKEANKFLATISATILSGIFLGYIDVIILGRFVESNIIGFYQAALSLVGALLPLIPFSIVLLPVFSRLKGNNLEKNFVKSLRLTFLFSLFIFTATIAFAPLAVKIIYGIKYSPSITILRFLALLLLVIPISSIYDSYFISQGKPQIIAKFLILSTILNIILNYLLITNLLNYSPFAASLGAAIATVISRFFYFGALIIKKKTISKI